MKPVLILAIETATDLVGAAIADADGLVAETRTIGRRRHAECLAPAIRHVLQQAGVGLGPHAPEEGGLGRPPGQTSTAGVGLGPHAPEEGGLGRPPGQSSIAAVAVDVGPGLFTGLRVGVATANGLAAGLGVPVVGIGSLEALAAGVAASGPMSVPAATPSAGLVSVPAATPSAGPMSTVLSVIDARRGQVFVGAFRDGRALGPPALVDPADLASIAAALAAPVLAAGDGARRYRGELETVPGVTVAGLANAYPTPGDLALLAVRRLAADPSAGVAPPVLPDYLRGADVRVGWTSRPVPAGGS